MLTLKRSNNEPSVFFVLLRIQCLWPPMIKEFQYFSFTIRFVFLKVSAVLGMQPVAFGVQHDENRESKPLGIAEPFEHVWVAIFRAVIHVVDNVIFVHR